MSDKQSITLKKEQETLLIPLLGKASYQHVFLDEKAKSIIDHMDYDFGKLKVPKKTATTLVIRAKKLDEIAEQFIKKNPKGIILHVGCGLDSRCLRIAHPNNRWFDLDFPTVITLRKQFFSENDFYTMIASSVTEQDWINQVPQLDVPYLIIAEGLLMYLTEKDIKALFLACKNRFKNVEIAFDAFSEYTVKNISKHPSMQKTGAKIQWGIDDANDIENWAAGYNLIEEWPFTQSPLISKFGLVYKILFKLTSYIDIVKKAQRILYFRL